MLDNTPMMLLHGPQNSGKTSMLLQCAFSCANRGEKVVVLMFRGKDEPRGSCMPMTSCETCLNQCMIVLKQQAHGKSFKLSIHQAF